VAGGGVCVWGGGGRGAGAWAATSLEGPFSPGWSRVVAASSTFRMKVLPQGLGDGPWGPEGTLSQSSDASLLPMRRRWGLPQGQLDVGCRALDSQGKVRCDVNCRDVQRHVPSQPHGEAHPSRQPQLDLGLLLLALIERQQLAMQRN